MYPLKFSYRILAILTLWAALAYCLSSCSSMHKTKTSSLLVQDTAAQVLTFERESTASQAQASTLDTSKSQKAKEYQTETVTEIYQEDGRTLKQRTTTRSAGKTTQAKQTAKTTQAAQASKDTTAKGSSLTTQGHKQAENKTLEVKRRSYTWFIIAGAIALLLAVLALIVYRKLKKIVPPIYPN